MYNFPNEMLNIGGGEKLHSRITGILGEFHEFGNLK